MQKCATDDDVPPNNNKAKEETDEATEEEKEVSGGGETAEKAAAPSEEAAEMERHVVVQRRSKWTTGAGPRIGCVREYPTKLQFQALEKLNLSPRITTTQHPLFNSNLPIPSPRPSPRIHMSPRLACMVLPSPRASRC